MDQLLRTTGAAEYAETRCLFDRIGQFDTFRGVLLISKSVFFFGAKRSK